MGEETQCSPVGEQGLLEKFFKLQLGYSWAVNKRNMLLVKLSRHIMSQHLKILTSQRGRGAARYSGLGKSYQVSEVECLSFLSPVQGRMVEKPCCNNLS